MQVIFCHMIWQTTYMNNWRWWNLVVKVRIVLQNLQDENRFYNLTMKCEDITANNLSGDVLLSRHTAGGATRSKRTVQTLHLQTSGGMLLDAVTYIHTHEQQQDPINHPQTILLKMKSLTSQKMQSRCNNVLTAVYTIRQQDKYLRFQSNDV